MGIQEEPQAPKLPQLSKNVLWPPVPGSVKLKSPWYFKKRPRSFRSQCGPSFMSCEWKASRGKVEFLQYRVTAASGKRAKETQTVYSGQASRCSLSRPLPGIERKPKLGYILLLHCEKKPGFLPQPFLPWWPGEK